MHMSYLCVFMLLTCIRICFDIRPTEMHVQVQPLDFSRIFMHRASAHQPEETSYVLKCSTRLK